jgi:F0F1-type ATP synthase alpha subunit
MQPYYFSVASVVVLSCYILQVVLEPSMSAPSSSDSGQGPVAFSINPKLSITRIGSRAYSKALEQLAPQIRLDLAQAEDARKFATNQDDPVLRR